MPSPTGFYKIVLFNGDECRDPRLEIPKKFVEKYGSQLSDPISLMVPTGGIWKVGLEKKSDQTVWLHGDGLVKFVQDNSIKLGYFMLFTMGVNCPNLNVHIFDWSAVEIQNYHPCPSLIGDSAARSFDEAHHHVNSTSSFQVTMRSYNIRKSFIVYVPFSFPSLHLLKPLKFIKLVDSNENKEWKVGLRHSRNGTSISKGWATFVHAKKLKVGNVCAFELIVHANEEIMLKVDVLLD